MHVKRSVCASREIPFFVKRGALCLLLFLMGQGTASMAQGRTQATPPIARPALLPVPALPLPKADQPLLASPDASALPARLQNHPLSIQDVVAIALATNRNLAREVEAYRRAQGVTTTSRAGLNPSLHANYNLDRYNTAQSTNIGGQSITTQQQLTNQLTASLSLPIDITGELRAAVSQAKFEEIAARLEINRVRNEIVLNVKSAFYNVLRDQALVKVAQDTLQYANDQLADARLRVEAGTVAHYDVTTALTSVANAQQTLVKNRSQLSQAFSALNDAIGLNVNSSLQLTSQGAVEIPKEITADGASSASPLNISPVPRAGEMPDNQGALPSTQLQDIVVSNPITLGTDYDSLLKEALKTRAEILREEANIAAARKGVFVARAGQLPGLSVGYAYTYTPNASSLAGQQQTGYASLTVSLPLYDGGATRGQVIQQRSVVTTAQTNRREQVDAITQEVRQAYLNLQQAQQSIAAARQELAQATEAYQLARLRYKEGVTSQSGVSPLLELSNARQSLSQAQSDYVNALYDFNNDRAALDKAVGRYSYN